MALSNNTEMTEMSRKVPTQLDKLHVRRSDFENFFMQDVRTQCDQIEKSIDEVLQACRKLLDKRFVQMKNKRVWYDRDTAALYPKFDQVDMPYCEARLSYTPSGLDITNKVKHFNPQEMVLTVDGIDFVLASPREGMTTFRRNMGNPYIEESGDIFYYKKTGNISYFGGNWGYNVFVCDDYRSDKGLICHDIDSRAFLCSGGMVYAVVDHEVRPHYDGVPEKILMMMIARLDGRDSTGLAPAAALLAWLQQGLIPQGLQLEEEAAYELLLSSYQELHAYLDWNTAEDTLSFRRDAFLDDVQNARYQKKAFGCQFDLPGAIDAISSGTGTYPGLLLSLRKSILECDYRRANLEPYADSVLSDINKGHWDLFEEPGDDTISIALPPDQVWTARPPQLDVVANGTCAIDFGTKSTVVVCRSEAGTRLLRIGTGDFSKEVKEKDYENPTVIDLRDLKSFEKAYGSRTGRPFTRWEELTAAHQAEQALLDREDADGSVYYSVFSELKQWAHEKDRHLLLKDRKGTIWKLNPYFELDDEALDPIEIYAYYLGLYINNMRHGIYLEYILSFPVNYDLAIRTKLLKSFERGLKKSLPPAVLADEECMEWFLVYSGASEPAAYAAAALQAYGLEPSEKGEMTAYGVFDFGGGTTDFDFGIEKLSANPRRHKFEIHQFGRGGDAYLGGENILNVLAFHVFCAHIDVMRKEAVTIALPHGCTAPAGTETLILAEREATQISFMNRKRLAEKLRPLWEERKDSSSDLEHGELSLNLFRDGHKKKDRKEKSNGDGSQPPEDEKNQNLVQVDLQVNTKALRDVIRSLISRGVDNFFEAWKTAFKHQPEMPDTFHILLAGNSCRSSIVKELFQAQIEKEEREISEYTGGKDAKGMLVLHMPLGLEDEDISQDAAAHKGEDKNTLDKRLTGKTGVAFGLLRSRKGGRDVKIINDNVDDSGEALFPYFLGDIDAEGHFCVRIGQGVPYRRWAEFCYADEEFFEIYYTEESRALDGQMSEKDVKFVRCRIAEEDVSDDDDRMIFLRKVAPDAVEYAVGTEAEFREAAGIERKNIIRKTLR